MDVITREELKTLLVEHPSPCVSVFMPAHRGGGQEDPVNWRKHLAEAEERLRSAGRPGAEAKELLACGRRLLDDTAFWKNQCDGLAAFLAPGSLHCYRLPLAFPDLVVVANRFHITPLLPLLSGNGSFYVLALSQKAVRLLQGTRFSISEVDLKGVPRNVDEALLTHEAKQPFSFVGRRTSQGAGSWSGIFHGHGVGIDDAKEELLHYFQKIDRGLHAFLKEEKAPLVLASVDYLQPIYRQANTYAQLLEQGVEGSPDRLNRQELHDRAWALVQPLFEAEMQRAAAQYQRLTPTEYASGDLAQVVVAAYEGRLETLFVAQNRQVWGTFDAAGGRVEEHRQPMIADVDLLNLAAVYALRHGGTVYAVEPALVPSGTAVAAIFRHPLPSHGKRA
jgi:hypothetical protein